MKKKECGRCKEKFPANKNYFWRNRKAKDGLHRFCKKCATEYNNEWEKNKEQAEVQNKVHSKLDRLRDIIVELHNEIDAEAMKKRGELGRNTKHLREELGMTQDDVAKLSGISRTQICNIELGNTFISIPVMLKLCIILKTDPNTLLGF